MKLATSLRITVRSVAWAVVFPALVLAQKNGQPATDQLGQEDLWGNPTFVGGVTNGGPAGHSIW